MPDGIKFSELQSTLTLGNNDLAAVSHDNGDSTYTSVKVPMTQLGQKVVNDIDYTQALNTTSKKPIGAINELKNELLNIYPVLATSPAPIANFSTDLALPLKSLTVEIKPKQAAGTPSPSNPLPISGTDTVVITQTDGDNQVITTKTVSLPSTVYGGEVDVIGGSGESNYSSVDLGSLTWLDTSTPNVFYATVSGMKAGYDPICYCSIYKGYSGYYTGMSNNQIAKNSSYRYIYIKDTRFASASEIGDNLDGIMLYYPVDTPTPITLANPIELTAINGVNNVFGDTDGNTSVEFRESVQKYVDDNIAAVQALIL